ncbi:MAG: hypothetical protein ABIQ35_07570 [Verrucomicrobiota bacterium]
MLTIEFSKYETTFVSESSSVLNFCKFAKSKSNLAAILANGRIAFDDEKSQSKEFQKEVGAQMPKPSSAEREISSSGKGIKPWA